MSAVTRRRKEASKSDLVEQIDLHASQSTSLLATGPLNIIFSNVDENCSMIQARDVVAMLEELLRISSQ